MNQSMNQSINQSRSSINQSIDQSINHLQLSADGRFEIRLRARTASTRYNTPAEPKPTSGLRGSYLKKKKKVVENENKICGFNRNRGVR